MRRLLRGFARWHVQEEVGWSGPLDVALLVLIPVAIATNRVEAYASISALGLLGILDRAWRLGT